MKNEKSQLRLSLYRQSDEIRAAPARASALEHHVYKETPAGEKRKDASMNPSSGLDKRRASSVARTERSNSVGRPAFTRPSQALKSTSQRQLSISSSNLQISSQLSGSATSHPGNSGQSVDGSQPAATQSSEICTPEQLEDIEMTQDSQVYE